MSGLRAHIFDYREGEGRVAAQTFGVLFLVVGGHTMLETARDTLFLSTLPASRLNLVYIGLAGLSLLVTTGTVAVARRVGQRHALIGTLVVAASATTLFHYLAPTPRVVLALYLLSGCIGAVLMPQFWSVAAQLFTVAQGRRLFGPIASGGVLGGTLGASAAVAVLTVAPVSALLPLAAALFVMAALLVSTMPSDRESLTAMTPPPGARPTELHEHAPATAHGSFAHSRLLFRMALLVAASTAALLTVDYLFKSTVARVVPAPLLGNFLARYYAVANALSLIVQLALASSLIRRLGVIGSLQVMPFLVLGGGMASIVAGGAMASVLAIKGVDASLRHSLNRVAMELLYLPVPAGERARARAFIDTVLVRVVQAAMSALLFVLTVRGVATPRMLAVLTSGLAAIWLLLASSLALPYLSLFREALTGRSSDAPLGNLDLVSAGAVMEMLSSADPLKVVAGVDLLASKGHLRLVPALVLRHEAPSVLIHALDIFGSSSRVDWFAMATDLLSHESEQVRMAAVRALARHGVLDAIERASADPSSAVQSYAVFQLAVRQVKADLFENPLIANIVSVPGEWGDALRIGLLDAIADSPDPRSANVLLSLASSRRRALQSPRPKFVDAMTASVARAMGKIKDPRFIPLCIEQLAVRDTREAAREALVRIGEPAFAALASAMHAPNTDRRVRLQLPLTIGRFASQRACDVLVERLFAEPSGHLRFRVLRALGKLVAAQPDVQLDRLRIETQARTNLLAYLRTLAFTVAVRTGAHETRSVGTSPSSSARLLVELLEDKAEQALDRAFRLLKIAHPREDIHRAHRAVRSGDKQARANAVEFVNTLLSHRDQRELRELMLLATDDTDAADRVARARHWTEPPPATMSEALLLLVRDPDDALAAVAAHHGMSIGDGDLQTQIGTLVSERPVLATIGSRLFEARAKGEA